MTTRALSDRGAVVLALAAAAGALVHRPTSLPVAIGTVGLAFVVRRPALLCVGAALLASAMGARCWAGLQPPSPHRVQGIATLVSDPEHVLDALHLEVRLHGTRLDAWARGDAAAALEPRLAGERIEVEGRVKPVAPGQRDRLAVRHISGQLSIARVGAWSRGNVAETMANGVRRTLERGVASLPGQQRALFMGFVLGDSRGQSDATANDFRNAGLTHLLVVSGENVAFILALAGPLLRLLQLRTRFVAGLLLLLAFGVLVRWEPSVLRAEAMAALALFATTLGRPVSGLRLLALAVTGLVIVDPVLVRSVGFLLSVGACAGIALWATPLAARIPGPRIVGEPLAVTIAAQLGVAPVLIPVFGGLPVAAIPANLLAIPAAGPLTMWGMTAGAVAGLAGGAAAAALHAPTRVLITWIAAVAHACAHLPLGHIGLVPLAVGGLCAVAWRRGPRAVRPYLVPVGALGLLVIPLALASLTATNDVTAQPVTSAAHLWRRGSATVVVLDRPPSAGFLAALRRAHVTHVDVLALASADSRMGHALDDLIPAVNPGLIVSPPGFHRPHLAVATPGTEVAVGGLVVRADGESPVRFSVVSR
ncbi:MAG: ComEC/Rec2 family competence protein [Actinobacteria bacterium]|nr:ComEC/Rec2 family competence protein [Actinomycetota bacterium]